MTENDPREGELRIYSVQRADVPMTREAALALHAAGYVALSRAMDEARARNGRDPGAGYDPVVQPKLALRAKGPADMEKALGGLEAAGIPHVVGRGEDGEVLCVHIAPCRRDDLPVFLRKLQLFSELKAESLSPSPVQARVSFASGSGGWPNSGQGELPPGFGHHVHLAVGHFPEAPLGKMLAQVGHAAWSAVSLHGQLASVSVWLVNPALLPGIGREVENTGGLVTDAGRTVFSRPTPTVAWTTARPAQALPAQGVEVRFSCAGLPSLAPDVEAARHGDEVRVSLSEDYVSAFLDRWPGADLDAARVEFTFDRRGNLIDLACQGDGPEVRALSQEAQAAAVALGLLPEQATMSEDDLRDAAWEMVNHRAAFLPAPLREALEGLRADTPAPR